jgi:hypothetical protein
MTDHDQQNQTDGHSTSGDAGGTLALSWKGREASPIGVLGQMFCLFGQVVSGVRATSMKRSGSESLLE